MTDETAAERRRMIETGQPAEDLAGAEQTWTTEQLCEEFTVEQFMAPFVIARRKSDLQRGTLEFTHSPRVYFNFKPVEE